MPTREEQEAYAKRMIERTDKTLKEVDESYLVKERGNHFRQVPTFRPEEISLGKTLGMGGFGIVSEIKGFWLDDDKEEKAPPPDEPPVDGDEKAQRRNSVVHPDTSDHVHYNLTKARKLMKTRAMKRESARYAIKRLHGALSTLERARGMIDLAVEAKYLSAVWHPNIIKIRGIAAGPMVDTDFFIILDRLYETLDKRINAWYKDDKKAKGGLLGIVGIGKNKERLKEMLIERMLVAYDIAAAMFYLHENRVVYRDIKPENIGFDIRGDVKVFDFGLCKSLTTELKAREGYGFRLTGRAGSLPYMAPEVVKMESYDTKCDVFSFAVLLWEMMSLKKAYDGYTPSMYVEKVVVDHERLEVQRAWPPLTRLMIPEAWDKDPRKRPDMKRVAILIRADLNEMTTDEKVLRRTTHMRHRSEHSLSDLGDELPPALSS